jgi:hypothetical protein
MVKTYIAFSIHGTNSFIVATKSFQSEKKFKDFLEQNKDFKIVVSRRDDYKEEDDGVKLSWTGLLNKETSQPYISSSSVFKKFVELKTKYGFKIVKDTAVSFATKHHTAKTAEKMIKMV